MIYERILLISISEFSQYSNPGIDQIAGFLRLRNIKCDTIYFHQGESVNEILEKVSMDYSFYGISVCIANYDKCKIITESIKEKNRDSIVFWGGRLVTLQYDSILNDVKALDYIVLGDGEKPLLFALENMNAFRRGEISHESIASYNDRSNKVIALNNEFYDMPAFDYFIDDKIINNKEKVYCLQTKNNICTGNCSFCFERNGKITYKNIGRIVDELEIVYRHYGVIRVFFSDDNIMDPGTQEIRSRIIELCHELRRRKLNMAFSCYIKANSFKDCDKDRELLLEMRLAGFTSMTIGIEAGNQRDLDLYEKRTTVKDNIQIVKLLKESDILPIIGFIGFNPYTTILSLKENCLYLIEVKEADLYKYICSFLGIIENTKIHRKVQSEGLLTEKWSKKNERGYKFKDKEVRPLIDFVMKLQSDFYIYGNDISSFMKTVYDYYTVYPKRFKEIKAMADEIYNQQFDLVSEYFYSLFVKNDLHWCLNNKDAFWEGIFKNTNKITDIYREIKGKLRD